MRRNFGDRRSFSTMIALCAIIALSFIGSRAFGFAVLATPFIVALAWLLAKRLFVGRLLLAACVLGVGLAATLTPVTGKFFATAALTGLFLPWFEKYRPEEDDWYFLVPLIFLVLLGALTGIDAVLRGYSPWKEFEDVLRATGLWAVKLNTEGLGDRILPPIEIARWAQGQKVLPWRATAVCASVFALGLYMVLSLFRRDTEAMHAKSEGFVSFKAKEAYLWLLILALAFRIAWHFFPESWLGQTEYALLFFVGTGFVLQTVAVMAWYGRRTGVGLPVLLASMATVVAIIAAPVLIAPIAAVGLADVWLNFRRLD